MNDPFGRDECVVCDAKLPPFTTLRGMDVELAFPRYGNGEPIIRAMDLVAETWCLHCKQLARRSTPVMFSRGAPLRHCCFCANPTDCAGLGRPMHPECCCAAAKDYNQSMRFEGVQNPWFLKWLASSEQARSHIRGRGEILCVSKRCFCAKPS